jgi:molybdenum cofactor cytidylyltransferase
MPVRFEGILLAAGESRRMGYPKPLLRIGDRTFVEAACAAMLEAVPRLIVVVGAWADRVRRRIPADPRIAIVENRDWSRGQLSSLKLGVRAVSGTADAALVHLADHPLVRPATFRAMVDHYDAQRPRPAILIARAGGRRGHPVIFAKLVFDELLMASDSVGAKQVVNRDPGRVAYLDVEDAGVGLDLDTPADLASAGLPPPPSTLD